MLRISQPKSLSIPAINYGIQNEKHAFNVYIKYQHSLEKSYLVVAPSGVIVNPSFLEASPDGAGYDPSNLNDLYRFLEIKCPHTCRDITPIHRCMEPKRILLHSKWWKDTFERISCILCSSMAIGECCWCYFVIFTFKGINVQRICFNQDYLMDMLLAKLSHFYDNCVAPELVSLVHVLGLPMRGLTKVWRWMLKEGRAIHNRVSSTATKILSYLHYTAHYSQAN